MKMLSALIKNHLACSTHKEPGSHHPNHTKKRRKKADTLKNKQFLDPLENWDLSEN